MARALAHDSSVELSVATSVEEEFADMEGVDVIPIPVRTRDFVPRLLWREAALGRLASRVRADLLFAPFPELPFRRLAVPSVMVVYDVGPLVAPAFFSRAKRARFALDLSRACRAATRVVCISNSTLVALHGTTGVDPEKCDVIGAAPTPAERAPAHGDGQRGSHPYVLYVGTMLRHKNVMTLVRAFAGAHPPPARLILAGPVSDQERSSLEAFVGEHALADRVEHLGWVEDADLATLYAQALLVAVPSLHEGYGLPVLEAMRFGVPVLASDIAAIREVAGEDVEYVGQPLRADAWRAALTDLISEPERRAALAGRARARATGHSWEVVGRQFTEVFRRAVGPSPRDDQP